MGTTLTGTTPQDTYDSLIKVTDNGPLSGTAKYLSDGLGNDSALALSTTAVGVKTNSPVHPVDVVNDGGTGISTRNAASNYSIMRLGTDNVNGYSFIQNGKAGTGTTLPLAFRFDSAEAMRITSAGLVGVGTPAPFTKLHVFGSEAGASPTALLRVGNSGAGYMARIVLTDETTADGNIVFQGSGIVASAQYIGFGIGANLDTLKLTGDNYLRLASGTNGLQFNGDTAAANALDDYEEGTWTPTFNAAITISGTPTGKYTKVGRSVYATCSFTYTALTGSDIAVSGLPFTNAAVRQATAVAFAGVARATNQFFGTLVEASATTFYIEVVNSASGVSFTAHASCWYQV